MPRCRVARGCALRAAVAGEVKWTGGLGAGAVNGVIPGVIARVARTIRIPRATWPEAARRAPTWPRRDWNPEYAERPWGAAGAHSRELGLIESGEVGQHPRFSRGASYGRICWRSLLGGAWSARLELAPVRGGPGWRCRRRGRTRSKLGERMGGCTKA